MQNRIKIKNKKARFEYELLDTFTAGLMLKGTEIKSIRKGKASITESFCQFKEEELYLVNSYIEEYENGNIFNHQPKRERKLLLNKVELLKIHKKVKEAGVSIVPLTMFLNPKGLVKIDIALGKGKKLHDKRHTIRDREVKRDLKRILKNS